MILPSDYDVDKEVANIDLCITEKVDGRCMFSFNENGASLAAKKMQEAGIPLIVPDSVGPVSYTHLQAAWKKSKESIF